MRATHKTDASDKPKGDGPFLSAAQRKFIETRPYNYNAYADSFLEGFGLQT